LRILSRSQQKTGWSTIFEIAKRKYSADKILQLIYNPQTEKLAGLCSIYAAYGACAQGRSQENSSMD
jgi:hypothetical protein